MLCSGIYYLSESMYQVRLYGIHLMYSFYSKLMQHVARMWDQSGLIDIKEKRE